MKGRSKVILLSILALLFVTLKSKSQVTNYSENYEDALKLYNYGMPDSALSILRPCLESKNALNSVSKKTRVDIIRLAALSCIIKGDPVKAIEYVRKLIEYQPDYKNNYRDDDLMEFRLMIDKTIALPDVRIGVNAGTNLPFVKLQKEYSNYLTPPGGNYQMQGIFGFQTGIAFEKALTKKISLELSAEINKILFTYTSLGITSNEYQYNQNLTYVEIPVLARYYFTESTFRPFLEGGIFGKLALNEEKSNVYGNYWISKSTSSGQILTTFLTDFEYIGLALGGGVAYDLKRSSIRLNFGYNYNFNSSDVTSKFGSIKGYKDISANEKFYYSDDLNLISMKNIQISISFLYNLNYKVF
jgi:Outer membrane protein beta-barrel domain